MNLHSCLSSISSLEPRQELLINSMTERPGGMGELQELPCHN
jgi:hypothetical protein